MKKLDLYWILRIFAVKNLNLNGLLGPQCKVSALLRGFFLRSLELLFHNGLQLTAYVFSENSLLPAN